MPQIDKRTVHVVAHTHWDREWYMPFESHRMLLVELIDALIELFSSDPDFTSFHLDGHTIPLEDYLEVRPEMRDTLKRLVREGKLFVGPWYVLQDEFLTSSEANIRNLLMGHKVASEFGAVCKVGYFPDSFGNVGQAPQILRQAGMDNAVFGRGVKPVGFSNRVLGSYESSFSEMYWRSPDGSQVLGILFANWYNNAMEIPTSLAEAAEWWKARLKATEAFASTPHLLFMNGCDHQPVQTDLSEALRSARLLFPDLAIKHSSLAEYIECVKSNLSDDMATIDGELRSQRTDGWWTLANTASARVYIKQENQVCQTLLEKTAEPLAAFASLVGRPYPHHLLTHAWKTLMKNHPHDSICGCSVDEVHREMMVRFAMSKRVGEGIVDASLEAIVSKIDTSACAGIPFAVFNTYGSDRTGVVNADIVVARVAFGGDVAKLEEHSPEDYRLVDHNGTPLDVRLEDLGIVFGYDLPKDRFRQPYYARTFRATFLAERVPHFGYRAYALQRHPSSDRLGAPSEQHNSLENEFLRVDIRDDGSLDILDMRTGRSYTGLGVFEDVGDIGNEYVFKQPEGELPLTTKGHTATISLKERSSARTIYEIVHDWQIPASADETLAQEVHAMVPFTQRKAQRSSSLVPMRVTTLVTLERGVPAVKMSTSLTNSATDHRLRVLFPTDVESSRHFADSVFEIAQRETEPAEGWRNPSNCQHQQAFVSVSDEHSGVTVANKGLNEYEVLRDGRNTVALTLLRAVGELGDWGVFTTPEAQCLGEHSFEYAVIPHSGAHGRLESYTLAYQMQVPWVVAQTEIHGGSLPPQHSFLSWTGEGLAPSSVKLKDGCDDLILRWFNMTNEPRTLTVHANGYAGGNGAFYKSNVLEEELQLAELNESISIRPAEIVTVGIRRSKG